MKGFLIDTNILSHLAPGRKQANPGVLSWVRERGNEGEIWISAMSVAEIDQGVRKLQRRGDAARAELLGGWLEELVYVFGEQVLPMDTSVARHLGRLSELVTAKGRHPGLADLVIAATAAAYDLTLVTDNTRHFELLGLRLMSSSALGVRE